MFPGTVLWVAGMVLRWFPEGSVQASRANLANAEMIAERIVKTDLN